MDGFPVLAAVDVRPGGFPNPRPQQGVAQLDLAAAARPAATFLVVDARTVDGVVVRGADSVVDRRPLAIRLDRRAGHEEDRRASVRRRSRRR